MFWFRRDLRLNDNCGLFEALQSGLPVLPVFVFDPAILNKLEDTNDRRVDFIHQTLTALKARLEVAGSSLKVVFGSAQQAFQQLLHDYNVTAVYANHDYEPYARQRDAAMSTFLGEHGISMRTFKDQVVFDKRELVKDNGLPYTVFTPFMRKWKAALKPDHLLPFPSEKLLVNLYQTDAFALPSLQSIGFEPSGAEFPPATANLEIILDYHNTRDIPGIRGTSRLSVHLRFGTISIRSITRTAQASNEHFYNELIWRNFYQVIIWHFPHVVGNAFKPAYDHIPWRNAPEDFERWCQGQTGYPIVDAGMRELLATGFMHNRVRMIAASFLTRSLFIDWRLGEAWFARHLLDFDLASNNGGWQWAAGSGCDAAPYFRIFNPTSQTQKFDPDHRYIKKWVPEYQEPSYPAPMVEHKFARERALASYKAALNPSAVQPA